MLAWTDSTKDIPPTPANPPSEADDIALRDYNLPIPSRMEIPNDYECNNNDNDNDRDEKNEGGDILVKEAV